MNPPDITLYLVSGFACGFTGGLYLAGKLIHDSLLRANKGDRRILIKDNFYYIVSESRYMELMRIELKAEAGDCQGGGGDGEEEE